MEVFRCNDQHYFNKDQAVLDNPKVKVVQTVTVKPCEELFCECEENEFFLKDLSYNYSKQIDVFVTLCKGEEEMGIDISFGTKYEILEDGYHVMIGGVEMSKLSISDYIKRDVNNQIENYISRKNQENGF